MSLCCEYISCFLIGKSVVFFFVKFGGFARGRRTILFGANLFDLPQIGFLWGLFRARFNLLREMVSYDSALLCAIG